MLDLNAHTAFWRRLAYAGARYGPRVWVRYSPPVFGLAFGLALATQRSAVRRNLRLVFGERGYVEEQWDVLKTFAAYASCLAESLGSERADAERARYRIRGQRHFENALALGRGLVIVTAHVGPWDVASRVLPEVASGRDVMVVMLAEPDAHARRLHDRLRERSGTRVVHVGEHALDALPLLRHLKQDGIVAMQLDRRLRGGRSIDVSLFGRSFEVPEGPFRLAALAGAPVVPLFARRQGYFDYEVTIVPHVELPPRPKGPQLAEAAQKAASEMERYIRAWPTQWFNFDPPR
jgi:KDO2-lipid IV(A) lauroyltransferase